MGKTETEIKKTLHVKSQIKLFRSQKELNSSENDTSY